MLKTLFVCVVRCDRISLLRRRMSLRSVSLTRVSNMRRQSYREPNRADFWPQLRRGCLSSASRACNVTMQQSSMVAILDFQIRRSRKSGFANLAPCGMGDCAACFRVGIIDWEDEWLTGQFTVTTPTGNARQAHGVGHSSIDAAQLYLTSGNGQNGSHSWLSFMSGKPSICFWREMAGLANSSVLCFGRKRCKVVAGMGDALCSLYRSL